MYIISFIVSSQLSAALNALVMLWLSFVIFRLPCGSNQFYYYYY